MYKRFVRRNEFHQGRLVRWKPELRNRKFSAYGECGVVVSLLPEPRARYRLKQRFEILLRAA